MAGIPCVNDTCSTIATVDANGRLNLDSRLNPNASIECVEGLGLGVKLDPSVSNLLSQGAAGLLAGRPGHQLSLGNGGTPKTWIDGSASDTIVTTIANTSGRDILAIVHVKWIFNFTAAAKEWEINGTFNSDLSIGSNVEETFSIGGADTTSASDVMSHQSHVTVFRAIPASSSLIITSYGDQKQSSTADGSGGAGGSISGGTFVAFHDILLLDSPTDTLGAVS